jgi:hypothetical protein
MRHEDPGILAVEMPWYQVNGGGKSWDGTRNHLPIDDLGACLPQVPRQRQSQGTKLDHQPSATGFLAAIGTMVVQRPRLLLNRGFMRTVGPWHLLWLHQPGIEVQQRSRPIDRLGELENWGSSSRHHIVVMKA